MPNPGIKNQNYCRVLRGSKNPRWNPGLLSYSGVHIWLRNAFGKASKCENCNRTEKVQWADKKHRGKKSKFERNRDDWVQLCVWCHKAFDGHLGPMVEWGIKTR